MCMCSVCLCACVACVYVCARIHAAHANARVASHLQRKRVIISTTRGKFESMIIVLQPCTMDRYVGLFYWYVVVLDWMLGLSYRYVCRQKCQHVHLKIVKCVGLFHRYMGLFNQQLGVQVSCTGMCVSKNVSIYTRVFVRCVGFLQVYVRLF